MRHLTEVFDLYTIFRVKRGWVPRKYDLCARTDDARLFPINNLICGGVSRTISSSSPKWAADKFVFCWEKDSNETYWLQISCSQRLDFYGNGEILSLGHFLVSIKAAEGISR